MLFMTKLLQGKKSGPLAKEVRRLLLPYRKHIKTITTDNGPEFAAHKQITEYLGAVVYFADPYASWQKGAVENTNKLIRQYIPKQANFDDFTDRKIAMIQRTKTETKSSNTKMRVLQKNILHLLVDSTPIISIHLFICYKCAYLYQYKSLCILYIIMYVLVVLCRQD